MNTLTAIAVLVQSNTYFSPFTFRQLLGRITNDTVS